MDVHSFNIEFRIYKKKLLLLSVHKGKIIMDNSLLGTYKYTIFVIVKLMKSDNYI